MAVLRQGIGADYDQAKQPVPQAAQPPTGMRSTVHAHRPGDAPLRPDIPDSIFKEKRFCSECRFLGGNELCKSPNGPRDLVTGQVIELSARLARGLSQVPDAISAEDICGIYGKWFEPKD